MAIRSNDYTMTELNKTSNGINHGNTKCEEIKSEDRQLHPVHPTACQLFQYAVSEWRCGCLTLLVLGSACVTSLCLYESIGVSPTPTSNVNHFVCQPGYIIIGSALTVLFYLVYLIECWNSSNWLQVAWHLDTREAITLFRLIRMAQPVIWWHIVCYHYEKMSGSTQSTVIVQNPATTVKPKASTLKKAMTVKNKNQVAVTKARTTIGFNDKSVGGSYDLSNNVAGLEGHLIIKCSIQTKFCLADNETKTEFERQKNQVIGSFEQTDTYMKTDQEISLPPFDSLPTDLYITPSKDKLPICARRSTFVLCALFLCSFPLRLLLFNCTAQLNYSVVKMIGSTGGDGGDHSLTNHNSLQPTIESSSNNEGIVLTNQLTAGPICKQRFVAIDNDESDELLSLDVRYVGSDDDLETSDADQSGEANVVENVGAV